MYVPEPEPKAEQEPNKIDASRIPDAICLFRYTKDRGLSGSILGSTRTDSGEQVFPRPGVSIERILAPSSVEFLKEQFDEALATHRDVHILTQTKYNRFILLTTQMLTCGGLCLAVHLDATQREILAFFDSCESITLHVDPMLHVYHPHTVSPDQKGYQNVARTFQRIFTIFDSAKQYIPIRHDPFAVFRLFRMRMVKTAELFGYNPNFLISASPNYTVLPGTTVDSVLFNAVMLMQFFSFKRFCAEGSKISAVFMVFEGQPVVCFHYRICTDGYFQAPMYRLSKALLERNSSLFLSISGEEARMEAEKIPAIRLETRNNPYPLGQHLLTVFSPSRCESENLSVRSSIFHLPASFYDGIPNSTDPQPFAVDLKLKLP